jgi:putative glutamine amidotransferase
MPLKIGITLSSTNFTNYPKWIKGSDDIEIIELSYEKENLQQVSNCDGIVLTGGVDVHPGFHLTNYTLHYDNAPTEFDVRRDEFELSVLERALELELPILGICRGLQLINCFYKGTLILDLGEQNIIHKKVSDEDKAHQVFVAENSFLNEICTVNSAAVNSAHHQAIDKLGNSLKVSAKSEDGIIEAVELITPYPFFLAVQWHPERMVDTESPLSKNIREAFVKACNKV